VTALERGKCAVDRTQQEADFWVQSADFFKLRSISATYQVPPRLVPGARTANFTLAGRNLFTITDYDGVDPEVADQRDSSFGRREYYNLPPMRTVQASLRVSF
jgi:TonB-dependent starch-binding outer membrane protein SusC